MKKIIYLLILNYFVFISYGIAEDYQMKQIKLNTQNPLDSKIIENYGNLWIKYCCSNYKYKKNGKEFIPIKEIEYYYKEGDSYFYIGKINIQGIYDKNNSLLCQNVILKERFSDYKPLGYMETCLNDPFYTGQYYLAEQKYFGALEPYAFISIDFAKNSLVITHLRD